VHQVPQLYREPLVLQERRLQRQPVHRGLRALAEVAALAPRDFREQPDSLPAADFVQPAAEAVAAVVEFQADFARTR